MMRKDETALRVLFVDDEPLILHIVSRFLNRSVVVKTVASAEEAFDDLASVLKKRSTKSIVED